MLRAIRKMKNRIAGEQGISLVEIVLVIVVIGISILPLSRLSNANMKNGGKYATLTRATYYAQEVMEQVIADYAAVDAGRGYSWVRTNWSNHVPANPPSGLSGLVTVSAEDSLNGVVYTEIGVTVSGSDIPSVILNTWIVENN